MSSPLYAATCLTVRGSTIDIELRPTPAIDPHFSLSDFYALAVLHEATVETVYHAPGRVWRWSRVDAPLARALAGEDMIDRSASDTPERRALTSRFIVRAGYAAARNWHPMLCTPTDGIYTTGVSPDAPGCAAAHTALRALASSARERSELPSSVLRVEVTDPSWIAHLEPTMLWDSYAFDDVAQTFI